MERPRHYTSIYISGNAIVNFHLYEDLLLLMMVASSWAELCRTTDCGSLVDWTNAECQTYICIYLKRKLELRGSTLHHITSHCITLHHIALVLIFVQTQLYGHCSPSNSLELASRVLRAIDSIHEWMSSNRLSLNTQDTIHLAWNKAQSCQERYRSALRPTSIPDRTYIREEPWFHHRPRTKHEGSCHQTLPVVLLPASPNTHSSAFTPTICQCHQCELY